MALRSIFGRDRKQDDTVPSAFDVSGTLYAIGDLHGMALLLDVMIDFVWADAAKPGTRGPRTVVFMGDYVDRGDDPKAVLQRLNGLESDESVKVVFLRGNHDVLMLNFIDNPVSYTDWLNWGGVQTLASFGIPPVLPTAADAELERTGRQLGEALGDLRNFIEKRTVAMHRNGNVLLTHAGLRPDEPFDSQPEKVMLWGSKRFLEQGGPPGFWTVHGHTIVDQPKAEGNRIAVDTGAYATGMLSAARISRDGLKFIKVE